MPASVINAFRGFAELNDRGPSNAGNALYGRSSRSTKGKEQPKSEGEMLKTLKAKADIAAKDRQMLAGFFKSVNDSEQKEATFNAGARVLNEYKPGMVDMTFQEFSEGAAQGKVMEFGALQKSGLDFVREHLVSKGIPAEAIDGLPDEYKRELVSHYEDSWYKYAGGDDKALLRLDTPLENALGTLEKAAKENEAYIKARDNQGGQNEGGSWLSRLWN